MPGRAGSALAADVVLAVMATILRLQHGGARRPGCGGPYHRVGNRLERPYFRLAGLSCAAAALEDFVDRGNVDLLGKVTYFGLGGAKPHSQRLLNPNANTYRDA